MRGKPIEKPNIVETYHINGTTVHICDNFIRTNPHEINQIIDDMHEIGWRIAQECVDRGEEI